MKIVFMGTPDFAVPTLEALIRGGHQVAAVVTQPDKPKGRGKAVLMTPVKEKAMEYGIPVYQPARVKQDDEFFQVLKALSPDAVVVTAFGPDTSAADSGASEIRLYQCPCLPTPEVPRFRTDSVGRDQRGSGNRRYHDDDGCRPGYRRYAGENCGGTGCEGDRRKPVRPAQPGRGRINSLHP